MGFVFRQNESGRIASERIVPETSWRSGAANNGVNIKPIQGEKTEMITYEIKNTRVGKNETVRPIKVQTDNVYTYWKKRYSLFSRFQDGIMLDQGIHHGMFHTIFTVLTSALFFSSSSSYTESFYSVCPEVISRHMADGCAFDVGIDPFCGAGGNVIQLAMVCKSGKRSRYERFGAER